MVDVSQLNTTVAAADAQNPTGAWSGAPSLAASTVVMENTSGHVVFADVFGGTVTAVKVNGVATGFTAGLFRLRSGDTLSITYSVAPTLTWTYEGPPQIKPAGLWAGAPSLASSTVAMTNTSGYDIKVNIIGGTVTVIKVNGVTTGLLAGTISLRPGHTFAITYSGAPTLAFLYA